MSERPQSGETRATNEPGRLVVLEGGDASGKSTVAPLLVTALQSRGWPAALVEKKGLDYADPFTRHRMTLFGELLWDYPAEAPITEWGDRHWLHMMSAWFTVVDRCRIQPLLRAGQLVIVDNWIYKFVARFLLKPDIGPQETWGAFAHLPRPDAVIFLDLDPEVAAGRRVELRPGESGRFDGGDGSARSFVDYQSRVRAQLLDMLAADAERWTRIDTHGTSPEMLASLAADTITSRYAVR